VRTNTLRAGVSFYVSTTLSEKYLVMVKPSLNPFDSWSIQQGSEPLSGSLPYVVNPSQ